MSDEAAGVAARIAALVEAIDRHPPSALKEQARAIVAEVLALHHAGLARIVAVLREGGPEGRRLLDRIEDEPLLAALLALHELAELPAVEPGSGLVAADRLVRAAGERGESAP